MEQEESKTRIKDIAKLAGVSPGTVDRVLHQRGNVSAKSREKVESALSQIDYRPNIYASALAQKKKIRIVCVTPSFNADDYWEYVSKGIRQAYEEMSMLNVIIDEINFDQYDLSSFEATLNQALLRSPDGIIFPPVFRQESLNFIARINQENIPFVFLDSQIKQTNAVSYFGQDSFRSGEIAAKLMLSMIEKESSILMFHTYRSGDTGSNQTTLRENGFLNFLAVNSLQNQTFTIGIDANDHAKNIALLQEFLIDHPKIQGAVVFNSLAHVVASYFRKIGRNDIALIGYDVLQRNIDSLKCDEIRLLIGQRPEQQGYLGVKVLCEKLLFNKQTASVHYMPIDIILKENVEFIFNK